MEKLKKKDIRAFQGLEAVLDENYKMLCDRVRLLEKSHKRLIRLLRILLENYDSPFPSCMTIPELISCVRDELERKVL